MKLCKLLILFLFLSLKGIAQTTITSNVTIDQNWINNNSAPWTISGSNVTVTFTGNLVLNNANHYFIITGSNVTIDGAGKTATISGVINYPGLVDASSTDASSLIKNIGLITTGITSLSDYEGYISKSNNKATIRSCYSTGEISGIWAGGIAGATNSGNISNCYSTGEISGERGGGVAGNYNEGNISNCYSTGPISAYSTGGISGRNNSGNILNCYSSGAISGSLAGGIAGARHVGSITDSRSSGSRTLYIGAEDIAQSVGTGTISNSINVPSTPPNQWDNSIANQALTGLGTIWNTSVSPYTLMSFVLSELTISTPIATLTSNCEGVPSAHTTFGVNGSGLTTPVIITSPSNFEISTSSSGSYSTSLTLPQASTVSQTVYIRLSSAATTNGASGTITANSSSLTPATTTVSSTTVAAPLFAFTGPYTICSEGTYAVSLTVANSYNGWSTSSNAISVNSAGYVTAGTVTGTYTVSYTDGCAQTASATVTVSSTSNLPAITDGLASYKFNNNPQGPIGSGYVNYVGYNGKVYFSQTRPIKTGFYKANNVSGSSAGSPTEFYIFRCTTCGTVSEYTTRPQGTLSGNTSGTGQLTYTSSNGGGPFTIVYQVTGGSPVTVNNISSTVAFNVVTPTITTSYKLISVTDENTKASTDFSGTSASITFPLRIGDSYQGGKIFYIDGTGLHGLIAATADQSTGIPWSGDYTLTGASGTAIGTGSTNTDAIISSQGNLVSYAAKLCADYSVTLNSVVYNDWYLPSIDELTELYSKKNIIGGFANSLYWSSTEYNKNIPGYDALVKSFQYGDEFDQDRFWNSNRVRAIRSF